MVWSLLTEVDRLAINENLTFEVFNEASGYLHQGRFAGAILPHERMNFAGSQCEIDIAKDLRWSK